MSALDLTRRSTLLALLAVPASACTRFVLPEPGHLDVDGPSPAFGPRAGVRLPTGRRDPARADRVEHAHEVHTELWLLAPDGVWELVHRAREPAWERADLVAGHYELRIVELSDGETVRPPAGREARRFRVHDGELATVELTLQSVPWEALVPLAVVVIGVVILIVLLTWPILPTSPARVAPHGDRYHGGGASLEAPDSGVHVGPGIPVVHDGPGPPALGLFAPLWPIRLLVLPCDVYVYGAPWGVPYEEELPPPPGPVAGPGLAEVVPPPPDQPAAATRVRFTVPMLAEDLGPDTLVLVGPAGPVATGVAVDEDGLAARVRPLRPLTPGRWVVRVLGRALRDTTGQTMSYDAQVAFGIGPAVVGGP